MAEPFSALKCLRSLLVSFHQPIFQTCVNFSYHSTAFFYCKTVPLRKRDKGNYSVPRAWQAIGLLYMLRKVLESVIGRRIMSLSEEHSLLPAQHMGAHPGKSIDIALISLDRWMKGVVFHEPLGY
jgi:hypothetical protein